MVDRHEPLLSLQGLKVDEERSENNFFLQEGGTCKKRETYMDDDPKNSEGFPKLLPKRIQSSQLHCIQVMNQESKDERENAKELQRQLKKPESSLDMHSFHDRSYLDDPENISSSDSDSDFSELDPVKRQKLRQRQTFCGIEVKKQFGFLQFSTIFFLSGSIMMIGVYMNAQITYMLPDKNYFNIPDSEIGMQTSNLTIYSLPFSLLTTFLMSYAYELFGRKLTISLSYLLTGIIYFMIPYAKPHFWFLAILRCLIGVTMSGPVAHPLINDYVRKSSRGKAIAINGFGAVCGEVMAMGGLLKLSKSMSYENAFALTGSVILLFSVFFWLAIKNPNMQNMHRRVDKLNEQKCNSKVNKVKDDSDYVRMSDSGSTQTFQELTMCEKVYELTDIVKKQLKKKPILYIVILGASITRLLSVLFSTYLILWINRNIIIEGTISADEAKQLQGHAKDIYIKIVVASALICTIVLPIVGKLCDVIDPRKIMPIAFLARCFTTYQFWLLKSPDTNRTFIVCVSMVVATISASVCCDSIFLKNLNKETRGILNGVFSIAGQIGILIFSLVGGWMFDNLGSKSPFVAIGFLDLSFTLIFCTFIAYSQRSGKQIVGSKNVDLQPSDHQQSNDRDSLSAFRFDKESDQRTKDNQ